MVFGSNYGQDQYIRSLQNLKNETEQKLQQAMIMQQNQAVPPAINQTFQISPNQNNTMDFDGKLVKTIDDVKNTFVIKTTLFVDDARENLWIKDVGGNIKTYTLQEVIELDSKDIEINNLKKEIESLKEMVRGEQHDGKYADDTVAKQKSTRISSSKPTNE